MNNLRKLKNKYFLLDRVHLLLFPYLLYPFHSMFMVASIYMTIAIAVER
jgi:hypothetical protein